MPNPKEVLTAYREDQKQGPLARPLFLARILAIAVACVGAIPTGYNLYMSWAHGIPYSQVSHRLEQYDLWTKNFDCKIDYHAVGTGKGTRVDVGSCPKSGDIALKLTTVSGKSSYEWIAYDQLEKTSTLAALHWPGLITAAEAQGAPTSGAPSGSPSAGMQVRCEARPQPGKVVRVTAEGGKCFREQISIFRGSVDSRTEVACASACPPGR